MTAHLMQPGRQPAVIRVGGRRRGRADRAGSGPGYRGSPAGRRELAVRTASVERTGGGNVADSGLDDRTARFGGDRPGRV